MTSSHGHDTPTSEIRFSWRSVLRAICCYWYWILRRVQQLQEFPVTERLESTVDHIILFVSHYCVLQPCQLRSNECQSLSSFIAYKHIEINFSHRYCNLLCLDASLPVIAKLIQRFPRCLLILYFFYFTFSDIINFRRRHFKIGVL